MIDPTKPLRAVSVLDPAIDRARTDVTKYVETRDPELLFALPGQALTWAVLRPLSVDEVTAVSAVPSIDGRDLLCFATACTAIERWKGEAVTLSPSRLHRKPDGTEIAIWNPEELQQIQAHYGRRFIRELGRLAWDLADSGNGWSGSVPYTLPLSSELGLEQIARHRAAQQRRIDTIASNTRSADASTSAPPPSSDVATDAVATGVTSAPDAAV